MPGIGVGIIGLGNVGGGTLRLLHDNAASIENKLGFPLEVRAVCSRQVMDNPAETANLHPQAFRTNDWKELIARSDVQIVAELIGGTTTAGNIITTAIDANKSVVTANKELIAEQGAELWYQASKQGVGLAMEASVGGGIPLLTALREGIAGDSIDAMMGILNGTSNYILTEIERTGAPLENVLRQAQELGYAEAEPSADIDGYDARSKLAILAALAFGVKVSPVDIPIVGIRRILSIDFAYAKRLGHTIRLLATARQSPEGLRLAVRPALVERSTILSKVTGSYNALWVHGQGGDTFYYGRGAGGAPTGVAVVSDLMSMARGIHSKGLAGVTPFAHPALSPYSPVSSDSEERQFYLRFRVMDRPGILAKLAAILADQGVSIDAVLQEPRFDKQDLPFVTTVEKTSRKSLGIALEAMRGLDFLIDDPLSLPMESGLMDI